MVRWSDTWRRSRGTIQPSPAIARYAVDNFHGGWQPDKHPSTLAVNELSDVLNLEYMLGGGIAKRGGYYAFTNAVEGLTDIEFVFAPRLYTVDDPNAAAPHPILSQIVFAFNESDGQIFYQNFGTLELEFKGHASGDDLQASSQSLGSASATASNFFRVWPVNVLVWDDTVYFTSLRYGGWDGDTDRNDSSATGNWATQSGANQSPSLPRKYNAQTGTWTRMNVPDLSDTDSTGVFPRARTAIVHQSRIFAANVHKAGDHRYPSRIYWSKVDENGSDPESWPHNNYIAVADDDGTEITRIVPFGDQILVFKNNSIWTLVGSSEENFSLYQLDKRLGTEGSYSADTSENFAFFFDLATTSVWQYDGSEFTNIGLPIAEYIRENLNYNAVTRAVVQVHGDYVWFSYSKGDSLSPGVENNETLIYDLRVGAWSRWDFGIVPSVMRRYSDYRIISGDPVTEGDSHPYFATTITDDGQDDVVMRGDMMAAIPDKDKTWTDFGSNFTFRARTNWFTPDVGGSRNRIRRLEIWSDESADSMTVSLYRDFINSPWQSFSFDPADHVDDIFEYHLQKQSVDINGLFNWLMFEVVATHDGRCKINRIGYNISSRYSPRGTVGGTNYHGAT